MVLGEFQSQIKSFWGLPLAPDPLMLLVYTVRKRHFRISDMVLSQPYVEMNLGPSAHQILHSLMAMP